MIVSTRTKQVSPCQLTETPTLRGFFLGQSVDEFEKLIPGFKREYAREKRNGSGSIYDTVYSGTGENRLTWKDVSGVSLGGYFDEDSKLIIDDLPNGSSTLTFLEDADGLHKLGWWFYEDKLYGFSIHYSDFVPDSAISFAKQLSAKTNIPGTGWVATDKAGIGAVLRCNGFKVNVHTAYRDSARVTVTDTNVETKVLRVEKEIKLQRKREEQERIRVEREKMNTLKP